MSEERRRLAEAILACPEMILARRDGVIAGHLRGKCRIAEYDVGSLYLQVLQLAARLASEAETARSETHAALAELAAQLKAEIIVVARGVDARDFVDSGETVTLAALRDAGRRV